jgi:hypothetical protein
MVILRAKGAPGQRHALDQFQQEQTADEILAPMVISYFQIDSGDIIHTPTTTSHTG